MDKTKVTNMSPGKNESGASKITGSDEKVWTIFPFKAVLFQVNMKIVFLTVQIQSSNFYIM